MRFVTKMLIVAGCTSFLAGGLAPPAAAKNFGSCDAGTAYNACMVPSRNVGVSMNLGPRLMTATRRTLIDSYNTTNLSVTISSGTADEGAEIHYAVTTGLFPGVAGRYDCINFSSTAGRCSHGHVSFSSDLGFYEDEQLQKLACHETGHAVGLWHPADRGYSNDDVATFRCMVEGRRAVSEQAQLLGSHNVGHINYPGRY